MKKFTLAACLILFCSSALAQAIYGVFSLPPATNFGEKQVGTISPTNGDISLLGSNTSIEDGRIDMTTGATALNVTDNKSYFIGEDNSDNPTLVDRIYTVDLITGVTDAAPALTAGYTTSNNFGIWYDDVDDVLYALFLIGGINAELTTIDPATGAVTTVMADVTNGEGVNSFASGLLTGDQNNDRIFAFINDSVWSIYPDTPESFLTEIGGTNFTSSNTFGLEWDGVSNALWLLYNPDLGDRQIAKIISEEWFDEAEKELDIILDGGASIATASGLSAVDEDSGLFFFIGRPSVGANANKWSLYTVDLMAETSSSVDIEDAALVQTNGYAGIEVLPGPDLTFTKTDGDISAQPGDTITYTLNYSNGVNGGATNGLTLTETVPNETTFDDASSTAGWVCVPDNNPGAVCTFAATDINPGGSGSVDFAVLVDAMVSPELTNISNQATLSATNAVNDLNAADTTPVNAAPDLVLLKTDNDVVDTIPGDVIVYDISIDNNGDRVADEAVLTETVPAHTFYVPTPPFSWNCSPDNSAGSTCTTAATDVDVTGLFTQFHVQVIDSVPAGTTAINNTVTVSGANFATDNSVDDTPVTSSAILSVNKTDNDITLQPGQSVIYQLDYANTGDQDAASTTLTETILAETQFDATNSTPGWVCLPDGSTEGNQCTFDLGTLGGGVSGSVDFALALNTPVPGIFSQLTNTVVLDASNASATQAQDTTPIDADVALRLVKTDGGVTAALGKVINYTLISFNEGDRNALNTLITETVPDNTTFYPPSSSTGWSCSPDDSAGSACTYDLGQLDGLTGKETVLFAVRVDDSLAPSVTELTNTATLSAFNSLTPDQDTVITPVDQVIPVVTLVDTNPSITEIASCAQVSTEVSEIVVSIIDDNPGIIGADNPANYALIDTGIDQDLQTTSCATVGGDDVAVSFSDFQVGGTAENPLITLSLTTSLNNGQHVLLVCDDITDAAGNALDGDSNGFTGGDFVRQFRVDMENLLANAYLDDCVDDPASLDQWNVISDLSNEISVTTLVDSDDSSLSGSIEVNGMMSLEIGVEQCVNFNQFGSHAFSTAVKSAASMLPGSYDLNLHLTCEFFDGADCSGSVINGSGHLQTFDLNPIDDFDWTTYQSSMLLPENTVSSNCAMLMIENDAQPYLYYADELRVIYDDVIFENGFEID